MKKEMEKERERDSVRETFKSTRVLNEWIISSLLFPDVCHLLICTIENRQLLFTFTAKIINSSRKYVLYFYLGLLFGSFFLSVCSSSSASSPSVRDKSRLTRFNNFRICAFIVSYDSLLRLFRWRPRPRLSSGCARETPKRSQGLKAASR